MREEDGKEQEYEGGCSTQKKEEERRGWRSGERERGREEERIDRDEGETEGSHQACLVCTEREVHRSGRHQCT